MRRVILPFLGLGLLVMPAALQAQQHGGGLRPVRQTQERSGFFFSVDLGGGYEAFQTDGVPGYSESELGGHMALRLGGTPSPSVRIGAELAGWGKELNQVDESIGSLMGIVQVFPSPASGFYLKGGAGLTYFNQRVYDPSSFTYSEVDDNGFGFVVGAGWEFPVGRVIALGPAVDVAWHDYGEFQERLVSFGLTISFP